jgi:hypothetical protein
MHTFVTWKGGPYKQLPFIYRLKLYALFIDRKNETVLHTRQLHTGMSSLWARQPVIQDSYTRVCLLCGRDSPSYKTATHGYVFFVGETARHTRQFHTGMSSLWSLNQLNVGIMSSSYLKLWKESFMYVGNDIHFSAFFCNHGRNIFCQGPS